MNLAALDYGVLFLGGFIAAAISGAAGFGGALILLPVMTHTIGAVYAVPVLTIAQLIGNLSRVAFGIVKIRWKPVAVFILTAIPFSILGAISFAIADKNIVTRAIGLFLIVFSLYKLIRVKEIGGRESTKMVVGGAMVGFISGLIGSAGPIGAAFFLSLNLNPISYIASEAVTAVVIHSVKIAVYQKLLNIRLDAVLVGTFIGLAMILGTFVSNRIIKKIPKGKFANFVCVLLIIIGLQMIFFG